MAVEPPKKSKEKRKLSRRIRAAITGATSEMSWWYAVSIVALEKGGGDLTPLICEINSGVRRVKTELRRLPSFVMRSGVKSPVMDVISGPRFVRRSGRESRSGEILVRRVERRSRSGEILLRRLDAWLMVDLV